MAERILEYTGYGVGIVALVATAIICAPFFALGWIAYRMGLVE